MAPLDAIRNVETFIVSLPRDVPYLGPLREGDRVNSRGYVVRHGNATIYPTRDTTLLVKVTGESGQVGWGETYGIVAAAATRAIIEDVLGPVMIGRDPGAPVPLHEDLYGLMRVRGACGGYYGDALAGVDIAVWDLFARNLGVPLHTALGGARRHTIPAYVSGLPRATLRERCDLAVELIGRGFDAVKFAAAVSNEGVIEEMAALREALGPRVRIAVDLHWRHTAAEAIRLIRKLEPYDPWFAEAPVAPEDLEGQAGVARGIGTPLALGEEWHNAFDARPHLERRTAAILQPEMGHTGVTEFLHIGRLAHAFHADVIPHATIGLGVFMAASLHASAALQHLPCHEYQHSVFDRNLRHVTGTMACAGGHYTVPDGPGLGVTPTDAVFDYVVG